LKNFIANIPIRIGETLYRLSARIVDYGIKLHVKFDTKIGRDFLKFQEGVKQMEVFEKKMEAAMKEAMKNPQQKNEDSKLSDIIKGEN
jgi:hypothetical protein